MLRLYFKNLYTRTMRESYSKARKEILGALQEGGACLDCGAKSGDEYQFLDANLNNMKDRYFGIEWGDEFVKSAQRKGISVIQGDLNNKLPFEDNKFKCIFGLSILEHLLYPCRFMKECQRCLEEGGSLVLLTPNISTFFTAALILAGKMPSSGPHPDSDTLIKSEEIFKVSSEDHNTDAESDTAAHRHLVIFSFKVLKRYLSEIGFKDIQGFGFGLYPFPNFSQKILESLDPYHCHQMVFVAKK